MSTSPTVLPVDAPPPIPSVSPYPNAIADLYYPNFKLIPAKPYDPNSPLGAQVNLYSPRKDWVRDEQPGENGLSFRTWNCIVNGIEVPNGVGETITQAAVSNVLPIGVPQGTLDQYASYPYFTLPAVPIPTRPLLPTETISKGLPGMYIVTNSAIPSAPTPQTPQEMGDSAKLAQIALDTAAIRSHFSI